MSGVRFTEEMKGFAGFGETDFGQGYETGRADRTELMFHLTIDVGRMDDFTRDPRRAGSATGWVGCHALGGRCPVQRGEFNLLVDSDEPGIKNMLYRLAFHDGVGHPLTLSGFKVIRAGTPLHVWPDTSTLYTRVLRGHVDAESESDAEVVASGILRIRKRDFARQLTTFRGPSVADVRRFGLLFAGELWPLYKGLTGSSRRP